MRVRHILSLLSGVFILSGCNASTAPATELKTISLVTTELLDVDTLKWEDGEYAGIAFGIPDDSNYYLGLEGMHPKYAPTRMVLLESNQTASVVALGYVGTWSDSSEPRATFRAASDWKTDQNILIDNRSTFRFETRSYVLGTWSIDTSMSKRFLFSRTGDNTSAEASVTNTHGHDRYVGSDISQERIIKGCTENSTTMVTSQNGLVIAVNGRVRKVLMIPKMRITCQVYSDMASANMALSAMRAGLRR